MNERKAIVPAGMEAVYERFATLPRSRSATRFTCLGRSAETVDATGRRSRSADVQAFENLKLVLEAAGASLSDVVDLTTFHTDMRDLPLFMEVRDRYLTTDPLPAWTAMGAHMLGGSAGYIVEIKAVAVLAE